MKLRVIILVLLAFGAALGTVYFARNWMEAQRAALNQGPPPPPPAQNEILVAKKDLPAGTLLKPDDLGWQAWPEEGVISAYIPKDTRSPEDFTGSVVREGIHVGQPVMDSMVVKPGDSGFLAAVLKPDMRAVSVSINPTTGISGFVFPGDRVDVILTMSVQDRQDEKSANRASETVLEDVRVIAVDQTTNDQDNQPVIAKNVTLEVTPKQAEVVTLVSELGKLSLSLRSIVLPEGDTPGEQIAQTEITTAMSAEDKNDGKPARKPQRNSYTWDSEASVLLPPPAGRSGRTVNVLHGSEAEVTELRSKK